MLRVHVVYLALLCATLAITLGLWLDRARVSRVARGREERARELREQSLRATGRAMVEADAARRARHEFLARMSHELRTPLNAVIGFSRVLQRNRAGNLSAQDLELIERIRASGDRLLHLVDTVLDQTRIESGASLSLNVQDADVAEIVRRVVHDYSDEAQGKGLRFVTTIPDKAVAAVDADRFEFVLEHIVDNAVKFTHEGEVRVMVVTDGATRVPTRVVVEDTGIGIASGALESVFEPFHQGENGSQRRYEGAGLGLPVARELSTAMGCRLSVESEAGKGSRFTLRLPETATLSATS